MGRSVVYDTIHVTGIMVISVLSTITNFIFVKTRLKTHGSNHGSMHLAVSFAVANLITSTVAAPLSLIADLEVFDLSSFACVVLNSPILVSLALPLCFLFAMTVERSISIFCPLRYPAIVTTSRTKIVTVLIWVYGIVCLTIPMMGANSIADRQSSQLNFTACNMAYVMTGTYVCFITMGNAVPMLIILLGLNLAIGIIATKRFKEETSTNFPFRAYAPLDVLLKVKKARQLRKLIIALLSVGQLFVASHALLLAALTVDYKGFTTATITTWKAPFEVYLVGMIASNLNTIIYPIILGYPSCHFRRNMRRIFFCRRTRVDPENYN